MGEKKIWPDLLAAPRDFVQGFVGVILGTVLTLAAAVAVIYAATKQLPALKDVSRNDGTRYRAIALTPPLEARASWARAGGELRGAMLEMKARMQSESDS